jgi:multicomponent K+:H+ antiporter subunit E
MLRLAGHVIIDIIRSNLAVARLALGSRRAGHAGFLHIRLELRNQTALTVLACIVTATPGTAWVSYDQHSGTLLLHILDLVDEQVWLDTIKNRYERRLMEIFES